jgi:SAM-dependent methyltransferase
VPLALEGFDVLAVDLSEEMLRTVGAKAHAAGATVRRLKANLVELGGVADGCFDYAACMFHTLGMIAGHEARQRALRHVQRVLRPGGTFVLHVHNLWFHLGTSAGRRMLLRHAWERLRGRASAGDFTMPPHQGIGPLTMHLFTRREILAMLRQAGFDAQEMRPISIARDGRLRLPWLVPTLRCYGFLIAARKPARAQG